MLATGVERKLIQALRNNSPEMLQNLFRLKQALIAAGLLFGVVVGLLFHIRLGYGVRAVWLGAIVAAVMVALEYGVWLLIVRATLEKVKKEKP